MYNKKITPYDNKEIIIGGCSLIMCDIRFQKTAKCKKHLWRIHLRLGGSTEPPKLLLIYFYNSI